MVALQAISRDPADRQCERQTLLREIHYEILPENDHRATHRRRKQSRNKEGPNRIRDSGEIQQCEVNKIRTCCEICICQAICA